MGKHHRHALGFGGFVKTRRYDGREAAHPAGVTSCDRFLDNVDQADPGQPVAPRRRRATALRRAHLSELAMRSAKVREVGRAVR